MNQIAKTGGFVDCLSFFVYNAEHFGYQISLSGATTTNSYCRCEFVLKNGPLSMGNMEDSMLGIGQKLRDARMKRNLSLRELGTKTDVSASLLSQIENEKANPSVRTLHSIADALELPVDYFFPERFENSGNVAANGNSANGLGSTSEASVSELTASQLRMQQAALPDGVDSLATKIFAQNTMGHIQNEPDSPIVRSHDRPTIQLEGNVMWARLTAQKEDGLEFMEITYAPGATSGERMSHHSGREFVLVMEGELTLDLGFEHYALQAGDSTIFDSGIPHRLSNHGGETMRAISVIIQA